MLWATGLVAAAGISTAAASDGEGALRFRGCTEAQRASASAARDEAVRIARLSCDAVDDPARRESASRNRWRSFRAWFGVHEPLRFEVVAKTLRATRDRLAGPLRFACGAHAPTCPKGEPAPSISRDEEEWLTGEGPPHRDPARTYAYARHGSPRIELCADFFAEPPERRALLLVHEVTHVAADTEDFSYRERDTLGLALSNPIRAVLNAASYQGFVESAGYGRHVAPARPRSEGDD